MSKTTLYLHIGTPKTGSTAIQRALRHNERCLRKKKLIYLPVPRYLQTAITKLKLKRKIAVSEHRTSKLQNDLTKRLGLKTTSFSKLQKNKKSDTLFILGSGSSVNKLTEKQWEQVRKHDSFGINFWLLHPHVPNFYSFETERDPRLPEVNRALLQNIEARKNEYRQTEMILKIRKSFDVETEEKLKKLCIESSLSISIPHFFTVGDRKQLIHLLKNYEKITKKLRSKHPDVFFLKNASIVFATVFGFDMGFKHLVYCGVDGHADSGYFYDSLNPLPPNTVLPPLGNPQGQMHTTMDPKFHSLTANDCLGLIYENLLQRNNVKVWVGTENSILSEWMPKWDWDKMPVIGTSCRRTH
jgi:hypothetical protein